MADRTGPATTYAMINLQERSTMLIPPGTEVYEGMIIGENSRAGDMEVNICLKHWRLVIDRKSQEIQWLY